MKLNKIIEDLRKELTLFKKSKIYEVSQYSKDIVSAIEIVMLLIEFAERNNSKIRKEDEFWFKGAYQVSREFEEKEWRNIGLLYEELVNITNQSYYSIR